MSIKYIRVVKSNIKTTPNSVKLFYGIGAFGYGSVGQTLGSFLMFFGTSILGIPGILMGVAVGLSTVWDATTDPFVGHMSDNTRSRMFGKRHGYILFGSIAVAAVNLLLWSVSPAWPVFTKFSVLLILLLLIETANTVYSTPYGALGLDLAKSYDERTAVQGFKTVFSFLSLLVPSLLMTWFLSPTRYVTMNATNRGYQEIALFTSTLCVLCALVCFFGTYKHRPLFKKENRSGLREKGGGDLALKKDNIKNKTKLRDILQEFFSIIKQKNVALLIAGYAVSLSAGAFITSLGLHVFTYTFGFSTLEIPIIMVCLIGGIIIGQPLWYALSRRSDKVTALVSALATVIVGIIIFATVLSFRSVLYPAQIMPLVCFTIFICGLGTGCLYSLPISMYADCVYKNSCETGVDDTAKSAGFLTFCTKISNALIMFIIGVSLDVIGFKGNQAVQSMKTQNWLGWLLVTGVAIAAISAIMIYSNYTYSKRDFEK